MTTVKNTTTRQSFAILVIVRSVPMESEIQEICQVRSPSVVVKLSEILAVMTVASTVLYMSMVSCIYRKDDHNFRKKVRRTLDI